MYIDPNWRILTIGDGDLSFSKSLFFQYSPTILEASILDSKSELNGKYSENELAHLASLNVPVHTQVDIDSPATFNHIEPKFDVTIFQFPLISRFKSTQEFQKFGSDISINTLNRKLLRNFLVHSFRYLLEKSGSQLCFITSKDVKPYYEWNLEESLNKGLDIPYLGSMPFESENLPGYRIRNIERDATVPTTGGTTYVWGLKPPAELKEKLSLPSYLSPNHCSMCRAGPFVAEEDRSKHYHSGRHHKMQTFEDQWLAEINFEKK